MFTSEARIDTPSHRYLSRSPDIPAFATVKPGEARIDLFMSLDFVAYAFTQVFKINCVGEHCTPRAVANVAMLNSAL